MRASVVIAGWMIASTLFTSAAQAIEGSLADLGGQRATLRLLEPEVDIGTRRTILAALETAVADDPDPVRLYALGSLYRRGDAAPEPAFGKDLDKAREYLSRAALAGHLQAMAKMSVLEIEAKNRFEANVWAQLYFHYLKDRSPNDREYSDSFAASIIAAAKNGLPDSELPALNDSVGLMVRQYDAKIRAGRERLTMATLSSPLREARPRSRQLQSTQGRPQSGVAEFYVAFNAKGEVDRVWLLDAWPDAKLARTLRPIAMGYEVSPLAVAQSAGAIALMPIVYGDQRVRVRAQD